MSRKLAVLSLWLAAPASADEPAAMARYKAFIGVGITTCAHPYDDSDIVVCARREGDRYRVPFVGYAVGDPRGESVKAERERISANSPLPCGIAAILAHCGMVGVTVGIDFGVSGSRVRRGPLAP